MLAVSTKRFRVPLLWTVLDRAGHSNTAERIALMQRYLALFGPDTVPIRSGPCWRIESLSVWNG